MTRVHPIPACASTALRGRRTAAALAWAALTSIAAAQTPQVLDIPTRPGVTNRLLVLAPGKPRKPVLTFTGGLSVGGPREARAFHGFNGLESQVVSAIARWMPGG